MPYSHKQHYSSPRRGSVMGVDRMVGRGWGKRPTSLLALRCKGGQRSLNACCIIFTRTTAKRGHSGSGCHKWRKQSSWRRGSLHKGRKRPWTPHQPYLGRAMTNHAKHAGVPKSSPAQAACPLQRPIWPAIIAGDVGDIEPSRSRKHRSKSRTLFLEIIVIYAWDYIHLIRLTQQLPMPLRAEIATPSSFETSSIRSSTSQRQYTENFPAFSSLSPAYSPLPPSQRPSMQWIFLASRSFRPPLVNPWLCNRQWRRCHAQKSLSYSSTSCEDDDFEHSHSCRAECRWRLRACW